MKEIFVIRKYEMIGNITFKTFESIGEYVIVEEKKNPYGLIIEGKHGERFESNRYITYTTQKTSDMFDYNDKFLPYFADLKQDLPTVCKFKPETYKNCQLMTEKHGGYLQFWDAKNREVRRIVINSHTYKPKE